jgi:uncharacterized damage-inducible protein DinB
MKRASRKPRKRAASRAKNVAKSRAKKRAAPKRPKRRSPAKKAAKSSAKRRTREKRAAKKKAPSRRPAAKAKKRAAKAKRRAARPAAKRRSPAKRRRAASRKPVLRLVRKPAARPAPAIPAPEPFAGAKANASAKDLVLFELVRARVALHGAVQGMGAGSAEAPVAEGKWSTRQIVLHLAYWDREVLRQLEDMARHDVRPEVWSREGIERQNQEAIAEFGHLDWESAKRLLQTNRELLLESLQSYPEEPASLWVKPHAVSWILNILIHHDRHHAGQIRDARTADEPPAL